MWGRALHTPFVEFLFSASRKVGTGHAAGSRYLLAHKKDAFRSALAGVLTTPQQISGGLRG